MSCDRCAEVDRHFALSLSPAAERALRAHLPTCAECTERYQRQLRLSQVLPGATAAKDRLGIALGLSPPLRRSRAPWILIPFAVALAAVVMPLVRASSEPDDGFAMRGSGGLQASALEAYRVSVGQPPRRVERTLAPNDELAFAYRNPLGRQRLLVFAQDRANRIYWFHPSWKNPAENPSAIAIEGGGQVHELKEAIAHPFGLGPLHLHALFTDDALTVKQVEAMVKAGTLPTADHVSLELQVEK